MRLSHTYTTGERQKLNTGSSFNSCYPGLQHIGLYLCARGPTLWLSPSALASDLVWACMWAHACLWGTDLESRSENARRRRPSASQLTASSSRSTEENMSTPDSNKPIFSIWRLSTSVGDYYWENIWGDHEIVLTGQQTCLYVCQRFLKANPKPVFIDQNLPNSHPCQYVICLDN